MRQADQAKPHRMGGAHTPAVSGRSREAEGMHHTRAPDLQCRVAHRLSLADALYDGGNSVLAPSGGREPEEMTHQALLL